MSIDEAIAKYKEITNIDAICPAHCNISCDKCVQESRQLAEWLEDYKHIKQWKSDVMDDFCRYDASSFEELVANVWNKAIDNYMNKLCNHCMQQTNECYKLECPFCTDGCDIVNIAEQYNNGWIPCSEPPEDDNMCY